MMSCGLNDTQKSEQIVPQFFYLCVIDQTIALHTLFCKRIPHLGKVYHALSHVNIMNLQKSGIQIRDMIKGNESDVGNIDFELQAIGDKC